VYTIALTSALWRNRVDLSAYLRDLADDRSKQACILSLTGLTGSTPCVTKQIRNGLLNDW
jgi:hypothetical protein